MWCIPVFLLPCFILISKRLAGKSMRLKTTVTIPQPKTIPVIVNIQDSSYVESRKDIINWKTQSMFINV